MRIYLPATLPLLEQWLEAGKAEVTTAYAVTPTLREWYREADLDELEHAAQLDASVGSLELLAADAGAPRRRVVVAADIEESAVTAAYGSGRAVLRLSGPVAVSRWGSALVDDPDADLVVTRAIASLAGAARGEDDAQFDLGEAEAYELGWYAVQELRYLA
ncbi:MAG TPA: hypothetical protein VHV79_09660 [Mycobacteriales bacterium]|nr:hypothetical protein [Mycobacteriales bacterium]